MGQQLGRSGLDVRAIAMNFHFIIVSLLCSDVFGDVHKCIAEIFLSERGKNAKLYLEVFYQ